KPFQARLSGEILAAPPFRGPRWTPPGGAKPQEIDHALRNEKDACLGPHGLGSSRRGARGNDAGIGLRKALRPCPPLLPPLRLLSPPPLRRGPLRGRRRRPHWRNRGRRGCASLLWLRPVPVWLLRGRPVLRLRPLWIRLLRAIG